VGVSMLPSDELLELRLPVLETLLGEEDDEGGVTFPRFIRLRGVEGADKVVIGKISTSSS